MGETPGRPAKASKLKPHTNEAEKGFISELKAIQPSAVFFTSHEPSPSLEPTPSTSVTNPAVVRKLPPSLRSLQKPAYEKMTEGELEAVCKEVFTKGIVITPEEAAYLEESTRLQAQSLLWFEHRMGRITASKLLAVRRASLHPPPASLVKQIMERSKISAYVPALQWGISNEDTARETYLGLASQEHVNLCFTPAGLHVNPSYPHLGATPDGVVSCECCGEGIIEIKCPYKHRDTHPKDITDPCFYLKRNEDGELQLSHSHEYYHQIQGQLAVCEKEYCDFICWTPHGMHTERILQEASYLSEAMPHLDAFFLKAFLPLLLTGRTQICREGSQGGSEHPPKDTNGANTVQSHSRDNTSSTSHQATTYCWCGGEDVGRMVACDNPNCPVEWFHFKCVGITRKPRGKWYCSDTCREQV